METKPMTGPRLLSLDFYRGFIMVLLALESAGLYEHLLHLGHDSWLELFVQQFFHHPWNGSYFWDLIQPGFMFIAGTAMALSLQKQWAAGVSWNESFVKILKRCGWLFFWGVLIYAVHEDGLHFELWNVLTQLSFTYLVAFLVFRWNSTAQIAFSLGLLFLTEFLYRFPNVPGFDQPFTDQHNFGNYMDLIFMNRINSDGWVAINCIPTAAHTIWGAVAGKLLLGDLPSQVKIRKLLVAGAIGLVVGYGLDWISITPIIKRIATTSFTLASGGWCLAALALFYWWIDIRQHNQSLEFFTIVGINSIFIYLFFSIAGHHFFNGYILALTSGMLSLAGVKGMFAAVIGSLVIFALEWGLCYFLYKKRIFFRL
jgi:predicted acyltransferase